VEAHNAADDLGEFDVDQDTATSMDSGMDIFEGLDFGSDDLTEQLENSRMSNEDFRGFARKRILYLEECLQKSQDHDQQRQREISDLLKSSNSQLELVNRLHQSEHSLQRQIEELKARLEADHKSTLMTTQSSQARIHDLENALTEREAKVVSLQQSSNLKDAEIEKLRGQCEQLSKDLAASIAARKSFEEESYRIRNDMRSQMDKLRTNMHNIINQDGEETKVCRVVHVAIFTPTFFSIHVHVQVLQSQNEQLQKEADNNREQLELVQASKVRLQHELGQLRNEIQRQREGEKLHIDDLAVAQDQVRYASCRVVSCLWLLNRCSRANALITFE
jgi:hypothetical protein